MYQPLPRGASAEARAERWAETLTTIRALLDGETDWVAAMSTVACELKANFQGFDWVGFYRCAQDAPPGVDPSTGLLIVGPYQGGHGCLRIQFDRGVCGAAARTRQSQLVTDVNALPWHIACSTATQSELVVPLVRPDGSLLAVLDLDSDSPAYFSAADQAAAEALCAELAARF